MTGTKDHQPNESDESAKGKGGSDAEFLEDFSQVYRRAEELNATKERAAKRGLGRIPSWIRFLCIGSIVVAFHLIFQLKAAHGYTSLLVLQGLDKILIGGTWLAVAILAFARSFLSGVFYLAASFFPLKVIMTGEVSEVEIFLIMMVALYFFYLILFYIKSPSVKGIYVGLFVALACEMITLEKFSFLLKAEKFQREERVVEKEEVGEAHVDIFGL